MNSLGKNIVEKRSIITFIFLIIFQIISAFILINIYTDLRVKSEENSFKREFHILSSQIQYSLNKGDYEGVVKLLQNFTQTYYKNCKYISLRSRKGYKIFLFESPEKTRHVFRQEKTFRYSYNGQAHLIYVLSLQSAYDQINSFSFIISGIFLITDLLLLIILRLSHSRKKIIEELENKSKELLKLNQELENEILNRKKIENELKQQNKYLDLIQTAVTTPFYIINIADYSIALANKTSGIELNGRKKFCYWETHKREKPCYDPGNPCPIEIIKETGEPASVEHVHVDEFGNKRIYQITGYPIFSESGKFIQMIEFNQDVTERKAQEEELKKLKIGIESLEEAVFITDINGNITYFNPSFQKIYGYEAGEILGKTPRILKSGLVQQEEYKKFWETILSKNTISGIIRNKRKDGGFVDVYSSVSPITNDNDELVAFLAIQRDVTEKLKMEEEIKKAKEAAEEADRMKAHFLSKISDEIEIPLKTFISYKNLLINKLENTNDKDLIYLGEVLEKTANRIKKNTELVLNYSEISIGKYKPVFASLDIYEDILLGIYINFQEEAEQKGLSLELNNVANVTSVYVDEFSTSQIFYNLLDNAIKYTFEGSVTISIFNNTNKEVAVEISDTGIGMSEEEIRKYFKAFETSTESREEIKEGVGIGLPLVRKYCELNNIELEINSTKGEGSSFLLTFKRNT